KLPADENLSVRLESQGVDLEQTKVQSLIAGMEKSVERPVGIESGNAVAEGAVDRGEGSAHNHFVVLLKRQSGHWGKAVGSGHTRVESGIQRAIGIEPGEISVAHAVDL